MKDQAWCKAPKNLMASTGFVSKKTGEKVELTASTKLVLIYMMDRNEYFTKKLKGQHYETQESIGEACGISVKTAGRLLRVLVNNKVITGAKKRNLSVSPHMCWYYEGVDMNTVFYKDHEEPERLHEAEKPEEVPKAPDVVIGSSSSDVNQDYILDEDDFYNRYS